MSDAMQLLTLRQLFGRIGEEYRARGTVFGIDESIWFSMEGPRSVRVGRESCAMPLGPAAGPHTQLAQNIVAAYLTGSRFFELKTVQILDRLEIEKPCIDAADEGYNVEWSTELPLDQSWQEYARAWIALHSLEEILRLRAGHGPAGGNPPAGFIFNASVGYDLKGILEPPMQEYLDRMTGEPSDPLFEEWAASLATLLPELAECFGVECAPDSVDRVRAAVLRPICRSVTLSTMHGCPPQEIESICTYMVEERELDTFVKLNPTLLGYDTVRGILDGLGYNYVELDPEGFAHDLYYADAVGILERLVERAKAKGRTFGVKLTNTLAVRNTQGRLPGEDMYLSGRALYPIATTLAAKLSREFGGTLPVSYCGGVDINNAAAILKTGIRPLTLCTVLLKPGGFGRQTQIAEALAAVDEWERPAIDVDRLEELARSAVAAPSAEKAFRGTDEVKVAGALPASDCYIAPCTEACPIGQHVPEYIRLLGERKYDAALRLIYERNALPAITGHICDHQCQHACTRLDYEGAIGIRALKRIAVEKGQDEFLREWEAPKTSRAERCAIVGAGPAGLSAAYFLRRAGFEVTVFEREENAGGVVRNVIPEFRLPVEAIEADIEFIKENGVSFEFDVGPEAISVQALRDKGFGPIVYAIGAEVGRRLEIDGGEGKILRSLDFLWGFRGNRDNSDIGEHVVVVGGGNTAMDAARAARTLPQVKKVSVLYRRSLAEMPADREEYKNAIADGVVFYFLQNPESIAPDGTLLVRKMELGAPDNSGRRRPVATERSTTMRADTIISAIGEEVDRSMLASLGAAKADGTLVQDKKTNETAVADVYLAGDAASGPSTVVRCIAAGRLVANAIADRCDERAGNPGLQRQKDRRREESATPAIALRDRLAALRHRKVRIAATPVAPGPAAETGPAVPGRRAATAEAVTGPVAQPPGTAAPGQQTGPVSDDALVATEFERCLECSYVCNKCVDVCPNRANITVATADDPLFHDPFQIVHLDAYCNECGNCAQFCPWETRVPYRDKPTVFSSAAAFEASTNDGWFVDGDRVRLRFAGRIGSAELRDGRIVYGAAAGEAGRAKAAGSGAARQDPAGPGADKGGPATQNGPTAGATGVPGGSPSDTAAKRAQFDRLFELLYAEQPKLFEVLT